MTFFWGMVWCVSCFVTALGLWAVNVVFFDNAVAQTMSMMNDMFVGVTPIANTVGYAHLFMNLGRYAPLFLVAIGIFGLIMESTIWGRQDTEY